jgi:hypothetical protein
MSEARFEHLLGRFVDDELSSEELSELLRLARDNPSLREEIQQQLECAEMIALSEDELRDPSLFVSAIQHRLGDDGFVSQVDSAIRGERRAARRVIFPWLIASAALMVLAAIVLSPPRTESFMNRAAQEPVPIARITELTGSMTWIGDRGLVDDDLEAGVELTGGTLEVHSLNSFVEIVFNDASTVWVSGPAELTLSDGESGKHLRLREGALSLDVSPQPTGKPLRLTTPSAEAVVLGTQFNVNADALSTRLTVNEGLVRVKRLADGSVQEVRANHRVVADVERGKEFAAHRRGEPVHDWMSGLPQDARQGDWIPGEGNDSGSLGAEAHIFRGDHGDRIAPILLHSAVVSPTVRSSAPVVLKRGARFRIRGRLNRTYQVGIGFGTHHARGGFSGRYMVKREINVDPSTGGDFELELRLDEFPRMRSRFPESPVGHELVWFWAHTVQKDVGLELVSVELLAP